MAFAKTLTSHSPYSTKWDYILLGTLPFSKWCVLNEGWRHLFIVLQRLVLQVAAKVRNPFLGLNSTQKGDLRGYKVGPAGLP